MTSQIVNVEFVLPNGATVQLSGREGQTLLELVQSHHDSGVFLEGACEGAIACTTCHVIVDEAHYPFAGDISEDEEDMLDMAYGLTRTSRLGCQVLLTQQLEGAVFRLPGKPRS
jgi:ferredoxin